MDRSKARTLVQQFPCRTCGAAVGASCTRKDGRPRLAQHQCRYDAYKTAWGRKATNLWELAAADIRIGAPAEPLGGAGGTAQA